MNVNGISNILTNALRQADSNRPVLAPTSKTSSTSNGRALPVDNVSIDAAEENDDKHSVQLSLNLKGPAHGVVHLLSENHFKSKTQDQLLQKFGHLIPPHDADGDAIDSSKVGHVPDDDQDDDDKTSAGALPGDFVDTPPVEDIPGEVKPIAFTQISIDILA